MNKRIKKLAEQATTTEYGVDNGFDRVTFDKEKFAQLIVKECADFIDARKRVDEYGLARDIVYGVHLLKRFGVER